jgi:hypothetical protein
MRDEVVALRMVAREVARLLENGAVFTEEELFEIGSVAGTRRARLQYYRRDQAA